MKQHEHHDLYWCPSLFEYPQRNENLAMDEHALWADLDAADPRQIPDEYRPTIAYETSEGRYQALWIAGAGDFQGASWPGNENQRMTYLVGADLGGWDTVQLLRIPEWTNHKLDRKGERGKVLWADGPLYYPGDFADLPEVRGTTDPGLSDALEEEIDRVDRHAVIARIQLELPHRARELLRTKEISGDRSAQQWWLTRCLADAGCSIAEIVSIIHSLPWNKFAERADEIRVLISEAAKAISAKEDSGDVTEEEEPEVERPAPQRLGLMLTNIKPPKWLVRDVITEGACGFVAGEPKAYKSWLGLDLALSVSTGQDFLGFFPVAQPGPVFYVQEEDPLPLIKSRSAKIWSSKAADKMVLAPDGSGVMWLPPSVAGEFDPDINGYVQQGVTISDEAWQLWLDETLEAGMDGVPYKMMILDTLMMTAGDIEENKAQQMTQRYFRPLKVLSRKHNIAVVVVNHMGKSDKPRAGQRMLGSVANHAWSEDSLYISRTNTDLKMEMESKSAPGGVWRVGGIVDQQGWNPGVSRWKKEDDELTEAVRSSNGDRPSTRSARKGSSKKTPNASLSALDEAGHAMTTKQVAEAAGISYQQAHRQLARASKHGQVFKNPAGKWGINPGKVA
jgi:hypothetical protein